jgi:hypothetical protein
VDDGRTVLIRFLCDADAGTSVAAAGTAQSSARRIDFHDLRFADQVKVKCILESDGRILARKVTPKSLEESAVIEAPLQQISDNGRVLRLLNLDITVPGQIPIANAGLDRPRAGQVVWLAGTYSPGEGLSRSKSDPGKPARCRSCAEESKQSTMPRERSAWSASRSSSTIGPKS